MSEAKITHQGKPFVEDDPRLDRFWRQRREKVLREHGLWDAWKCVPPAKEREHHVEAYLPGGEYYDG